MDIRIEIRGLGIRLKATKDVGTREPALSRRIIPSFEVIEAGFIIPFLAGELSGKSSL